MHATDEDQIVYRAINNNNNRKVRQCGMHINIYVIYGTVSYVAYALLCYATPAAPRTFNAVHHRLCCLCFRALSINVTILHIRHCDLLPRTCLQLADTDYACARANYHGFCRMKRKL